MTSWFCLFGPQTAPFHNFIITSYFSDVDFQNLVILWPTTLWPDFWFSSVILFVLIHISISIPFFFFLVWSLLDQWVRDRLNNSPSVWAEALWMVTGGAECTQQVELQERASSLGWMMQMCRELTHSRNSTNHTQRSPLQNEITDAWGFISPTIPSLCSSRETYKTARQVWRAASRNVYYPCVLKRIFFNFYVK